VSALAARKRPNLVATPPAGGEQRGAFEVAPRPMDATLAEARRFGRVEFQRTCVMPKKLACKPTSFGQIVKLALQQIRDEQGLSQEDFFMIAMGYSAVGLLLLNLDFIPKSIAPVGWVLAVVGLFAMLCTGKKL
jgi:hypothetical protein